MTHADHPPFVRLPITLRYALGAYTAAFHLGEPRQAVNLIVDTGSSSLAVLPSAFDPERDTSSQPTSLAQTVSYGGGRWTGPVLKTTLHIASHDTVHPLPGADLALIEAETSQLRGAHGLIGLAYAPLDQAHDLQPWLVEQEINPAHTWPWPFSAQQSGDDAFQAGLLRQPRTTLTPALSALAEHGVVADKFAIAVHRALLHMPAESAVKGPDLNQGHLWLGIGEELTQLYREPVQHLRVVHDEYYNVELRWLRVADQAPIAAPPLAPADLSTHGSNAIFDTGCSFVMLESSLYLGMMQALSAIDPRLVACIESARSAMSQQRGIGNALIDALPWPTLCFGFLAEDGSTAELELSPNVYWQRDALVAGESWFVLAPQLPGWPRQSIFGLPMMCHRYTVFDRRVDGLGAIRVAEHLP